MLNSGLLDLYICIFGKFIQIVVGLQLVKIQIYVCLFSTSTYVFAADYENMVIQLVIHQLQVDALVLIRLDEDGFW